MVLGNSTQLCLGRAANPGDVMIIQPSSNLGATALAIAWSIWRKANEEASNTQKATAIAEEVAKLGTTLSEAVD